MFIILLLYLYSYLSIMVYTFYLIKSQNKSNEKIHFSCFAKFFVAHKPVMTKAKHGQPCQQLMIDSSF